MSYVTSLQIAGSLWVRVRRDANEQQVLSQVIAKFAPFITPRNLTVQVVKDDWATPRKAPSVALA
jgi:hypothetical protein